MDPYSLLTTDNFPTPYISYKTISCPTVRAELNGSRGICSNRFLEKWLTSLRCRTHLRTACYGFNVLRMNSAALADLSTSVR